MIHCLCKFIVQQLVKNEHLPNTYTEWAVYVLEKRFQGGIGFLGIWILGCYIASPLSVIALLLPLYLINSRSGGFHCSTFGKCFVFSLFSSSISLGRI